MNLIIFGLKLKLLLLHPIVSSVAPSEPPLFPITREFSACWQRKMSQNVGGADFSAWVCCFILFEPFSYELRLWLSHSYFWPFTTFHNLYGRQAVGGGWRRRRGLALLQPKELRRLWVQFKFKSRLNLFRAEAAAPELLHSLKSIFVLQILHLWQAI